MFVKPSIQECNQYKNNPVNLSICFEISKRSTLSNLYTIVFDTGVSASYWYYTNEEARDKDYERILKPEKYNIEITKHENKTKNLGIYLGLGVDSYEYGYEAIGNQTTVVYIDEEGKVQEEYPENVRFIV